MYRSFNSNGDGNFYIEKHMFDRLVRIGFRLRKSVFKLLDPINEEYCNLVPGSSEKADKNDSGGEERGGKEERVTMRHASRRLLDRIEDDVYEYTSSR